MKSFKKKVAALVLIVFTLALVVPYHAFYEVNAATITSASKMNAYDFTSSSELAKKLTQVFAGKIGLYSGGGCKSAVSAPLGCSKLNGRNKFYIKDGTSGSVTFGWQCYIYANAVYNTLYHEWIGRAGSLKHSKVVIRGGSTFSYKQFVGAGVKVGAYVRTTANRDGSYNGSKAHSFIILGYNEENVTYIDGNSDGRGLVRVTTCSWKALNSAQTTGRGRKICHVVQPTDKYYNSLYGKGKAASSGSHKEEKETKKETEVSSDTAKTTAVDPADVKVKFSRTLSYAKNKKVMSGKDVRYMQAALKSLGYSVNVNSKYDSKTANAVKKFQKAKKLTVNGKINSKTFTAIEKAVKAKNDESKKTTDVAAETVATVDQDAKEFRIVTQPQDMKVKPGVKVTLKIEAEGEGLSYKWYYKKKGAKKWSYWPKHDCASSLSTPNKSWDGLQFYCVVTNADGETIKSEIAHAKVVK